MRFQHIASNAVEDGVEDFFSAVIYQRMREYSAPFLKDFEGEGAFNEAMQSFINTLAMGTAIYALSKIMTFFFERGMKLLGAMFTYIYAGKIKKALYNRIKNDNSKGRKLFKKVSFLLGADRTKERIEMMKIAQSNVDSFDSHKMHYEKQHTAIEGNMNSFSSPISDFKSQKDMKSVNLFTDLTFRGAWQNTTEHKKIYESATGYKLAETGQGSWSKLYLELNKYTEFHTTANNEVTNLATVLTKVLATKGAV